MQVDEFSLAGRLNANEDSIGVTRIGEDKILAVVADGIGGMSCGKEAADLIVSSIAQYVLSEMEGKHVNELLHGALVAADVAVTQQSIANRSRMGAAVAVAYIVDGVLYFTWQGNVRIYMVRDGFVKPLSEDHVMNVGYGKTCLTRCIKGGGLRDDIPMKSMPVNIGDSVILCTDGLYREVGIEALAQINSVDMQNQVIVYNDDASFVKIDL